ncbi:FAD-dependent oxidoreductase [Halocatena halophila]|uniref:FAD-dependent oxidoreductase n=1 Tax=Halocatena halophila TaxID=2814576 RepID=UPI002ED2F7F7
MNDTPSAHRPSSSQPPANESECAVDVVIVGGGPSGCGAGISTARYGLETLVFDRGNASLRQCAYLENFLGFPGGIDVPTFYDLMHDHVSSAGGEVIADRVCDVTAIDSGFRVDTDDDRTITAPFVVATSSYDGGYLRGLDDDTELFETHCHDGETHEHFDSEYVREQGRTPIDGLYVAGGLAGHGEQALIAAGHGMTVGRALLEDVRRADGWWDEVAPHYDWRRRTESFQHDFDDTEALHELFDATRLPDDHNIDDSVHERVRATAIELFTNSHIDRDTVDQRIAEGYDRLVAQLDQSQLLERIDDDVIERYVRESDQ